ncbi:molybdopterin molybdotransferase MoeA [Sulfurivermis fontis]|uniref:molybdopterin molybdotransferase MoeA n=1 Tax=Sulfurivermis fontis TaxID=1972068 RepID=UPI000FDC12A0|nr:molybdopterin molybdotransferase MoeA [Sulfurivermis fontis]
MSQEQNSTPRPALLSVAQALEYIRAGLKPITGFEQRALRDALGRVLASDVSSPIDVPPHANSAMDGYALRAADLPPDGETALQLIGTALAGHPYSGTVASGQCVRIMTGAKLPTGADTVVMQENARREGDTVYIGNGPRQGDHVRLPGEDIANGQIVLQQGRQLTPADLGLLASLGIAEVKVARRLRVAFFSTGDELRSLGETLQEGQIYDSNRYTLYGMLSRLGVEIIDMGVVRDRREDIVTAFRQGAAVADVLITSGGVSVGDADYVKETLESLGKVNFWKIAMKPGKPLAFGLLGETAFFGLPGNPVSSMATFYQLVQPALQQLMGQTVQQPLRLRVPCMTRLKKTPGRADYQRGILEYDAAGQLTVRSTGAQGSHVLSSMSRANCFIILPAECGNVEAGTLVEVQPFAGLI